MYIDLDAHQGNGHERDFTGDEDTFIVDAYNYEIYPNDIAAKEGIDVKIEFPAFTGDTAFLSRVQTILPEAFETFQPDFVIYIAGTDILAGDRLGALDISAEGVIRRDEMVFRESLTRNIPVLMLLGGGYQQNNAEVITRSILNLKDIFGLF